MAKRFDDSNFYRCRTRRSGLNDVGGGATSECRHLEQLAQHYGVWISQRARRSASSLKRRADLSTTLRANGRRAEGSDDESWTKKTVPIAPLPKTLRALRFSRSSSGEVSDDECKGYGKCRKFLGYGKCRT